jgi:hypothetical protein
MTATTNGRSSRPSLAQQIDRLDLILDNLSEGLQEAVADAVKMAVTRAVEAAVREVLTNSELRRHLLTEAPRPQAKASGTLGTKADRFARSCWQATKLVAGGLLSAVQTVSSKALDASQRMQRRLGHLSRGIWWRGVEAVTFFRQVRRSLVVALSFGLLVGIGCFIAGPVVASAVSGLAGFVGSLATVLRCRRLVVHGVVHGDLEAPSCGRGV